MKLALALILLTLTLQATELIREYPKTLSGVTMRVWCFEGTKWLWAGNSNTPPVQIMSAHGDYYYKVVPKPVPCKEE